MSLLNRFSKNLHGLIDMVLKQVRGWVGLTKFGMVLVFVTLVLHAAGGPSAFSPDIEVQDWKGI